MSKKNWLKVFSKKTFLKTEELIVEFDNGTSYLGINVEVSYNKELNLLLVRSDNGNLAFPINKCEFEIA